MVKNRSYTFLLFFNYNTVKPPHNLQSNMSKNLLNCAFEKYCKENKLRVFSQLQMDSKIIFQFL